MANDNNGIVIPFFKWSFNDSFYSHLMPEVESYRHAVSKTEKEIDLGFFADASKKYLYPTPSSVNPWVSCTDINKFGLAPILGNETGAESHFTNNSRPDTLKKLGSSRFTVWSGGLSYSEYLKKSLECKAMFNPPGVGEYTSRMMDQSVIGNTVILRKNSYDQGHSWKNFFPEIDLQSPDWQKDLGIILENSKEWREKSRFYYKNLLERGTYYISRNCIF